MFEKKFWELRADPDQHLDSITRVRGSTWNRIITLWHVSSILVHEFESRKIRFFIKFDYWTDGSGSVKHFVLQLSVDQVLLTRTCRVVPVCPYVTFKNEIIFMYLCVWLLPTSRSKQNQNHRNSRPGLESIRTRWNKLNKQQTENLFFYFSVFF